MGLYTKIKGPVNYTVVGSPTITDGILSNTSGSDYLYIQNTIGYKDFEIVIKVKYSNNSSWHPFLQVRFSHTNSSYYAGNFTLQGGGRYFYSYNSSQSYIQCGGSTSTSNWNWIKLIKKESTLLISRSDDGINYTTPVVQVFEGTGYVDDKIYIGEAQGSSSFGSNGGSIDLNETYIKVNNIAWFGTSFSKVKISNGSDGYTIIGSPIINQGTMTNLSPSDYITTKLSYTNIGSFEINIKCKLPSDFESKMPIVVSYGNKLILGLNSGRRIYALFNNGAQGITGTTTLSLSGIYYLRYTLDENKVAKVYVSIDGKTYSLEGSITLNDTNYNAVYTNSSKLQIGTWSYGHSYSSVDTIYLNQSNIIINNKMIWNGIHQDITSWKIKQDNFSKYYTIVDGKLMWANPNIYLESTGTQWIDTGIKANQNTTLKCKVATIGSGNQSFFGLVDNSDIYGIGQQASGSLLFAQYYGSSSYRITAMAGNDGIARKFEFIKNEFYIDGVLIGSKTYKTFTTTNTIKLFTLEPTGTLGQDKGYYFEIYDDTVLIRKFVPVPKGLLIGNFVVPSNGMFDIVEQKFYENKGTGEFTIGGIPEDYIIEGGKLIWCNPNIYLDSSGTQWIDTNFKPNQDTKVKVTFSPLQDSRMHSCLFGARNNSTPYTYYQVFMAPFNSSYTTCRMDYGTSSKNFNFTTEVNSKYELFMDKNNIYIDESLITTKTYEYFQCIYNIVICGSNVAGTVESTKSIKRYYNFIIYDNTILSNYFVPVPKGMLIGDKIATSNCMFDLVTQTFFENQGTGDFIIGGINGDYINVGDNIVWVNENVYLKSTRTQYIDTNYKPNNNTCLDYYVKFTGSFNNSGNVTFCGCRNSDETQWFSFNFGGNANQYSQIFNWVVPYVSTSYSLTNSNYNTKQNMSITLTQAIWGTQTKNLPATRNCNTNVPVLIYGYYSSIGPKAFEGYDMQIYNYFKITEGTKLIRYLLPVNTNTIIGNFTVPAPGMWDAVTKTFYPNKGTGTFTYGKDE